MPGTHEGQVIVFGDLTQKLEAFESKPHAQKLVDADGANIVILEFKKDQAWHQHHSVHPIVVQTLKGKIAFTVKGQTLELTPGSPIHLTSHLLHELVALEDSTIMVTMLTGESHPNPVKNSELKTI